jgi:hypothetical protein
MASHAPATVELIENIKTGLHLSCKTQDDFRLMLNAYLTPSRRIKDDHSGVVQISRWLNIGSKNWSEPRSEIILAMQKVLEELRKIS